MILKFNEVIYKRTFTLDTKEGMRDIVISITDKESEELTSILVEIIKGTYISDRLDEVLFKEDLTMLRKLLVGSNYVKFQRVVLADFQNFLTGSIEETIKKVSDL